MRLVGPDTVLFAVGLFLFLGAGYALVQLDGGADGGLNTYQVTWTTATTSEVVAENIGESASGNPEWNVAEGNLTKVTVAFTCNDPNPAGGNAPVRFTGEVTAPSGDKKKLEGTCGSPVAVTFDLAEVPQETAAFGSETSARQDVAQTHASDAGIGTWSVSYTTQRQGPGGLGGLPTGPQASGDLEVTYERYQPQLTLVPR